MKKEKPKKKFSWQQWLTVGIFVGMGFLCGLLIPKALDRLLPEGPGDGHFVPYVLVMLVSMYVAIFLQTVIHEAGHLVFGLLSGYSFSSFRIMSFMLLKENGKMVWRRLSLAGTAGQCLMSPPDLVNGDIPVTLYNLGGCIMNLIASALFAAFSYAAGSLPLLRVFFGMNAILGIGFALTNGIPLHLGTVDNDGRNALSLRSDPEARRAFWVQLKVNEQIARGVRLKDMPEEWFAVPDDAALGNSLISTCAVFAANRMLDAHDFVGADKLMEHLLSVESGVIGLHRSMMICDRIYCELIGENRKEVLAQLYTEEEKRFMKSMKNFPSVLRTEYALALLAEENREKAEKLLEKFRKTEKTYPYPSDIQSERELLEIVQQKA